MAEKINNNEKYVKILVAKYSPKNGCNAKDEECLGLFPLKKIPLRDYVFHFFTSLTDCKTKSKYAWVKIVAPFTLDEFIMKYVKKEISEQEKQYFRIMFDSIVNLPEGTPVAVTYNRKSIEEKIMEIKIHKVFLYG